MVTISLQEPKHPAPPRGWTFFSAGFRPLFWSCGMYGAVMLPLWLLVYSGRGPDIGMAPILWHGHEMIFGFSAAAVGGFLLTAVPNWTGTVPVAGRPLMVLYGLWLAGRAAVLCSAVLPSAWVAVVDLLYLPALAYLLARPLIAVGKMRNLVFLPILATFTIANALVHLDPIWGTGLAGLYLGITLLLVMIAIIGGRIVPAFTQNWLRMQGQTVAVTPLPWLERVSILSLVLGGVLTAVDPAGRWAGAMLLAAGLLHLLRLGRWHGLKTVSHPILWVLHLGYAWMGIGLILLGGSSFLPVLPVSAAIHALTAGAIGTMILAVMSRAALGHSGRPLVVGRPIVAAYGLLSLGTILRVAAPMLPSMQMGLTHAGGSLWAAAWLIFAVVYAPICFRARSDGRPG